MKINLLHFSMIAIILFLGACSNEALFNKNDKESSTKTNTEAGRTLSLTASMPDDDPTTRVALTQDEDKGITLTWETGDQLQIAFVQGTTKIKETVTVKNISTDGKTAEFDIVLPEVITGKFDLYGVYGGRGLSMVDYTHAQLPISPYNAGNLISVQEGKHVMLHFASKDIEATNPKVSVNFEHLGSLFNITVKNTSDSPLTGLAEARLVGINNSGNENWAYNNGVGGGSYDLVNGVFLNPESAGNYISFRAVNSTVASGATITFWGWYPSLPDKNWPELKLELRNASDAVLFTSTNTKPARATATVAGKSYYFFTAWNGSKLQFTDQSFTPPAITSMTASSFYTSTVVITGNNFSPDKDKNIVKFGTKVATVIEATSTSLSVTTPDLGSATTAEVTVTVADAISNAKTIAIDADQSKINSFNWDTHTVKPGVTYKKGIFTLFGNVQRRIYILDVTLNSSNTLGIGFSMDNAATTTMCKSYNAIAGINAGYFPMAGATANKDPYVRINGVTVQVGHAVTSAKFSNSALIIHQNVAKVRKFTEFVTNLNEIAAAIPVAEAENMIVCGPILISNNVIETQDGSSHNTSKTARTGLGVTADGKRVFMVVVDTGGGYTGVSTPDLAKIMQALGAVDAMNFDGGGSSTMFIDGQGDNGLVNFPYGNSTQRAVRSVIYVK